VIADGRNAEERHEHLLSLVKSMPTPGPRLTEARALARRALDNDPATALGKAMGEMRETLGDVRKELEAATQRAVDAEAKAVLEAKTKAALTSRVEALDATNKERSSRVEALEATLTEREATLKERTAQAEALEATLKERDSRIEALEATLKERDAAPRPPKQVPVTWRKAQARQRDQRRRG
jgi:chromosome segregation ATPase